MRKRTKKAKPEPSEYSGSLDELPPTANDPGGSHAKGYSAEANEDAADVAEPVPLVPDEAVRGHVKKPDQSRAIGSHPEGQYTPNDRLMGADR